MQLATPASTDSPIRTPLEGASESSPSIPYADYKIIRRNGSVVTFEPSKIAIAMTKAFIAVHGGQAAASARIREQVEGMTGAVVQALLRRQPHGGTFHIEDIQDQVELSLMRSGEHDVARAYVLYREKRNQERAAHKAESTTHSVLHVIEDGVKKPLDMAALKALVDTACEGLGAEVHAEPILQTVLRDLYDGVPMVEVEKALVLAARAGIERDPGYAFVSARLLLNSIRHEVLGRLVLQADMGAAYVDYFPAYIKEGIGAELLDARLAQYDLPRLAAALDAQRDLQFGYLGLQTLYDRYFLHIEERRIELPQAFFMRVAMGLALNEIDREARAIEFIRCCRTSTSCHRRRHCSTPVRATASSQAAI
jgi:Ribonucleotide reductase, alpha subunit